MIVLGIETSCDETAVAIVKNGKKILSNEVYSQIAIHRPYGGVVPEIASRKHIEIILVVLKEALNKANLSLKSIDVVAVTQGPGLVIALLVGICVAKAIAFALKKPLVAINHLEAHLAAIFLEDKKPDFPFIGMVVSGGHTNLYFVKNLLEMKQLGQTLDDAAGEAFDKVAKLLNLSYPGGISIEELAKEGNPKAIRFPRPRVAGYNVSFSGLKTAVANYLKRHPQTKRADVAASFQEAVVDTLINKALTAIKKFSLSRLVIAGGVAANKRLREKLCRIAEKEKIEVFFPSVSLCTDNAAMVAALGYHYFKAKRIVSFEFDAISRYPIFT
ncbi:MAG TPA: tRNA (adenosine(37)-N6)-threonylcarbamoyltransferase complex transferase subunit TsaD [Candidatus Desulfofervidus auxilii]|uniref:tRNA N6-adenosine threonylcarbamoyltransferase n=1 Tax=Desulfofervidus auxilii TaxID=1621989 RepID=A0A7V0NF09_DESA2|nr:tRNA (adenosine(37)-N6)-threonylcarbamoyltransferase complex transferase subunit TsaD [Candidatus Desulfofervidus auxilii]